LVYTPDAHTVEIEVDGTTVRAILQDIQFHPVTDRIQHIDFYQIFDDKEVTMTIPVKFTGNSKGVLNGGVLRKVNRKLKVKALPDNLPDYIQAEITELKIGNKLYVTSINQENFKIQHPDNTVICQVKTSRYRRSCCRINCNNKQYLNIKSISNFMLRCFCIFRDI